MKKALALLIHLEGVSALTLEGVVYSSGITEVENKLLLLQLIFVELCGKKKEDDKQKLKAVLVSATNNINDDNLPLVTKRPSG